MIPTIVPIVGKSSVINVLVASSKNLHGAVRVGVAAQPGKTKHFQTLLIPDRSDMMLCDCPGLVFPSFVSSTADLIAAGVFPIAQMRDHWPVVSLICKRVPRDVLNAQYGIVLPEPSGHELREKGLHGKPLPPPTAEELLGTYCIARSIIAPARYAANDPFFRYVVFVLFLIASINVSQIVKWRPRLPTCLESSCKGLQRRKAFILSLTPSS